MGRTTLADDSQGVPLNLVCPHDPKVHTPSLSNPAERDQSSATDEISLRLLDTEWLDVNLEAWFNVLAHYSSRNTQKSITGQYKRSRPSCQHKRKEWGVSIDPTNWILKLLVESEVIFSPPSRNRGRTPLSRSRSVNVSFDDLHVSIF
ncbi:hypothetical protein TWF569_004927 [Orbilia oligospora]|uniref:Uncharacterized protein n=1 Tax=Orbilia oligospora TaxID=2813651 RepID=A0A7C8J3P7_ORBOL|nr:hypothetical protein TWF103_004018 [Orbilia oligospora]KAF3092343.1 hypothetical protein TWF102_008430 [Orbilia oligospora]KAF3109572.1 hypothetical protein TWF706_001433 [Orbilia oligospora]KAF3119727.1 hypothetical protein TWF703_003079 [Orbilia oligospora]KAF3122969.1 hypothetical protein TWF594_002580 [Orbilia oligospora]